MHYRRRRDIMTSSDETEFDDNMAKNVNVTVVGHTGVIHIADDSPNTEMTNNELTYKIFNSDDEYVTMYELQDAATTISTVDVISGNIPAINNLQRLKLIN